MRKPISQREARRLQHRVKELLAERDALFRRWSLDYPGGVNIETVLLNDVSAAKCETAARLDHVLICKPDQNNRLRIYAVSP